MSARTQDCNESVNQLLVADIILQLRADLGRIRFVENLQKLSFKSTDNKCCKLICPLKIIMKRKGPVMSGKLKKNVFPFKARVFNIRWYPSSKSCVHANRRNINPQQMPPLMVRKAEWRR